MTAHAVILGLLVAQAAGTQQGAQPTGTESERMMRSPFDPKTASWEIGWPGRVSKHDLAYLTPPTDPMQGLPLGNGDVGVLCWCEDTKLVFAVNKCDLWDDAPFGRFHNWKPDEEETSTTLRHACRLILDFHVPIFDVFYLSDFKGRLSLADATMTVSATTPFGDVSVRGFVSLGSNVFCCEVTSGIKDNVPVSVTIERYGSRSFSHWYSLVNRDPTKGLAGTAASVDNDAGPCVPAAGHCVPAAGHCVPAGAYITHELTTGTFAVGCSVVAKDGGAVTCARDHAHAATLTVTGSPGKAFTVLLTVTPPMQGNPIAEAKKALASAREQGTQALFASHAEAWKAFWLESLMEFGDDYLDNLWHLTMYYANASQRGAYPGRFLNGLWTWSRDVQNWNFYFHWNQQQVYWPLNAAGHPELVDAYLKYRFDALPYGQQDAREVFHTDGAVVSDVCERRGYNSASEFHNHTPAAQVAMDFWRQYRFSGDREFLSARALPYILEAAKFFESLFERGDDGLYHAKGGTAYEGWIVLRDGITELVYARALFSTALAALAEAGVVEPRAKKWSDILDHLAPLPTVKAGPDLVENRNGAWTLKRALFKGATVPSDEIFAAGFGLKENRPLTSFVAADEPPGPALDPFELILTMENNRTPYSGIREDMKCYDGIFPWVEFAPVFPSNLIGVAERESPQFKAAVNSAKVFGIAGMGWDPLPIVLARLGLSDELTQVLALWPGRWQFYCNGFGHYGPRDLMKADASFRFRSNLVRDSAPSGSDPEKARFPFPTWPFRHMGMESMSVLACAMNEALLQSHDGVIRITPAADHRDARFTLHATDGFVVSAEIANGEVRWVCVVSRLGKTCRLDNPWPKAYVFTTGADMRTMERGVIEFATKSGDVAMIVPEPGLMKGWKTMPLDYEPNQNARTSSDGKAALGLPRMF